MKLSALLAAIGFDWSGPSISINGLSLDSRQVEPGDLFIAIGGTKGHGQSYVKQALENGAVAILSDKPIVSDAPIAVVPALNDYLPELADRFYPLARQVNIFAVTGTNGKTSIAYMLSQVLNGMGMACACMGTLGHHYEKTGHAVGLTTTDILQNYRYLDAIAAKGARYAAMEVSSHALAQGRIRGLSVKTAIFTNLSRDHLDYHQTMAAYGKEKAKLFQLPGLQHAIINTNDAFGEQLINDIPKTVRVIDYAIDKEAQVKASNVQLSTMGTQAWIDTPWGSGLLKTPLVGIPNVQNALTVITTLCAQGIAFHKALSVCQGLPIVPGRMQRYSKAGCPTIYIDYAHTPEALKSALVTLSAIAPSAKRWCIAGCGGNRDAGKRPMMGEVAEQYADHVVITNDNPRWESPEQIAEQMQSGMHAPEKATVCLDRALAIKKVLKQASETDVVLIAGKGHESGQEIEGKQHKLKDMDIVRQYFEKESHSDAVV